MLNEFMVWSESKMREKGEEWSANHMLELLEIIEGLNQDLAMSAMRGELHHINQLMAEEQNSVAHGALWSQKENVAQALRGGAGELFFKDHDPRNNG